MLKKIISSILVVFLIITLTVFSIFQIAQTMLSADNIIKIVNNVEENMPETDFAEELLEELEYDENYERLIKYVDKDKFNHELGAYLSNIIIYFATNTGDRPSTDNLRKVFDQAIKKYQKETDQSFDATLINEVLKSLDNEIDNFKEDLFGEDEESRQIFSAIYGPTKIICLILSIVIILVIFLINNKDVISSIIYPSIGFIINGLGIIILGYAINKILSSDQVSILNNFISSIFYKFGTISFVLGIILLIIRIVLKRKNNEVLVN